MTPDQASYEFTLLNRDRPEEIQALLPNWRDLIQGHANHYVQYQSPEWWEHLSHLGGACDIRLIKVERNEQLVGIVPMQAYHRTISVVPGDRLPFRFTVPCVEILGSQPLLPPDERMVSGLLQTIFRHMQDIGAIYFKSISQQSAWYDLLINAAKEAGGCFPHVARDESFHYLTLPDSFDAFLQRFRKKKRYNLKRQLRLMEEAYGGKLEMDCVTTEAQVAPFLEASTYVASKSWKQSSMTRALESTTFNQDRYSDLARRGLLRSYVLRDDNRPVAYALGYQFLSNYHYSDVAYDKSDERLSPGTVLLFLIVKDLIETSSLRLVNFGASDADYKRQFADQHTRDRSVYVFRSGVGNRLLATTHHLSRKLVRLAKERICRPEPSATASEE